MKQFKKVVCEFNSPLLMPKVHSWQYVSQLIAYIKMVVTLNILDAVGITGPNRTHLIFRVKILLTKIDKSEKAEPKFLT